MEDELKGKSLEEILGFNATYIPADPGGAQSFQVIAAMNERDIANTVEGLDMSHSRSIFNNLAGTEGAVVTTAQNATPAAPAPEQQLGMSA